MKGDKESLCTASVSIWLNVLLYIKKKKNVPWAQAIIRIKQNLLNTQQKTNKLE